MSEERDDIADAAVTEAGGVATSATSSAATGEDPSAIGETAAAGAITGATGIADAAVSEAVPEEAQAAAGVATSAAGAAASQAVTDPGAAASAATSAAVGSGAGALGEAAAGAGVPSAVTGAASGAAGSLAQGAIQSALSSPDPESSGLSSASSDSSAAHHAGFQSPAASSSNADSDAEDETPEPEDEGHVQVFFDCEDMNASFNVLELRWTETLNEPFLCQVKLGTDNLDLELGRFLGADCSLGLVRNDQEQRLLGICAEVTEGASSAHRAEIELTLVPALQLLSLRKDTRIFQEKTVPEILDEVLVDALGSFGRTHRVELDREYPTCEYRVQYNETDLAFVQRLMGEEGIVYWFDHEADLEELVLVDDPERHPLVDRPNGETLDVRGFEAGHGNLEVIREFHRTGQMRPTRVSLRHWSWSRAAGLEAEEAGEAPPDDELPDGAASGPLREEYEHDDQPLTLFGYDNGSYADDDTADQSRLRRERQRQDASVGRGHATVMAMRAGTRFSLSGHRTLELDADYLLRSVTHHFCPGGQPESGHKDPYYNTFECLPVGTPFRPKRIRKPAIHGVQTATVVGPAGDEIHTDEHGRIRVQFHWDRHGNMDEHSSCYLRVMQAWAGPGWGFVFLPRIGMEVMITFVSGDPDRPIVTGSLYNHDNTPPNPLPDEKTKSTIKTSSSPGGDGYNELTFEDAAGEEQIIVHAQKDYNETIENNHSKTVHGSQTQAVDGTQSETIGGDQTLVAKSNRMVTVEGSQNVTVNGGSESGGVTGASLNITGDYKLDASKTIAVQAPDKITLTCGDSIIEMVPGKITLSTAGSKIEITEDIIATAANGAYAQLKDFAKLASSQGSELFLDANGSYKSSQGSEVKLTADVVAKSVPGSELKLDAAASLSGTTEASVEAPMVAVAGQAEVKVSAAQVGVEGSAMTTVKGGSGSVMADPSGVTIQGPVVKVN